MFQVEQSQYFFGFKLPSSTVREKFERFLLRYKSTENEFCNFRVHI